VGLGWLGFRFVLGLATRNQSKVWSFMWTKSTMRLLGPTRAVPIELDFYPPRPGKSESLEGEILTMTTRGVPFTPGKNSKFTVFRWTWNIGPGSWQCRDPTLELCTARWGRLWIRTWNPSASRQKTYLRQRDGDDVISPHVLYISDPASARSQSSF